MHGKDSNNENGRKPLNAKTPIQTTLGQLVFGIFMFVAVSVPIMWKIGIEVGAYQEQNYRYQAIMTAFARRRDCLMTWELKHRSPMINYSGECGHLPYPMLNLREP